MAIPSTTGIFPDDDDALSPFGMDPDAIEVDLDTDFAAPQALARRGQNEADDDDTWSATAPAPTGTERDDDAVREAARERMARERAEIISRQMQERYERQLVESEKRHAAGQKETAALGLDSVDLRIRTAREALKEAKSAGDVSAEVDLTQQLNDLQQVYRNIQSAAAQIPDASAIEARYAEYSRRRQSEQPAQVSDAPVSAHNPQAHSWAGQNGWMSDQRYVLERRALLEVNNQLAEEGYNAAAPEFFTELSRRLHKRFPNLGVRTLDGRTFGSNSPRQAQNRPGQSSPPVASARMTTYRGSDGIKRGRVQLDGSDRAIMRALKIDTANPKAVQAFAREKARRLASEQHG
jgi:hypothetical protein